MKGNMQRNANLIQRKIHQYILPGILMTVAMQLGNVVDGMIVGNFLGTEAMAAIELSMPVLLILQMPAMLLSVGGAAECSVLLGRREMRKASEIFSASLAAGLLVSFVFAAFAGIIPGPLAAALTGNETLAALVEPYIMVNFAGIPILTVAIIVCYFMNVDNHPQLGSALFIIANVVNLVLDIVFLKVFHMGMTGSALSTIIGYLVGLVTVIAYYKSKHRMLQLVIPKEKPSTLVLKAAKVGIPSASVTAMSAFKSIILNSAIVRFLGNDSMAVYSVCVNAVLIAELFVGGIIGLISNIAGILYGEQDYFGIRALCAKILKYSYGVIVVLVILFFVFPQGIAALFGIRGGEMLEMTNMALRIFALSFPLYVYNKFLISYYQTTLKTGIATAYTILQGFVLIVPLTLFLLPIWQLPGVCVAVVISEGLTILIGLGYGKLQQKRGKFPGDDLYMLPKVAEQAIFDYTITNQISDVVELRNCLMDFCQAQNIAKEKAKVIGLALEEIAVNIVQYGYRSDQKNYIDTNFTIQDGTYILRIRDDGIPFDPLSFEGGKEEDTIVSGIALLKKMISDFQYTRVLNMNNTIIKINLKQNETAKGV